MGELTHLDGEGKARMVDVGGKPLQRRLARAVGRIRLAPATVDLIRRNGVAKGDVLSLANVAGIQGAKQTAALIPLCHPLNLDKVEVRFRLLPDGVEARGEVRCTGRTGVEMEALTAVAVALLTIYDMCKAVDSDMQIEGVRLVEKVKEDA